MTPQILPSYKIQSKTVQLPVEVRDASAGVVGFTVPLEVAQRLVGEGFEVAEFLPRKTLLFVACVDYRDNDLGDYNEVALNFFVRQKGARKGIPYLGSWLGLSRGKLASFSYKMPVNQSFTCEAGNAIWGFPKSVERIYFDYSEEGVFKAHLEMEREVVFDLVLPRRGTKSRPESKLATYSYINGIAHCTEFSQRSEGVGESFGSDGVELRLGTHPIAETLRAMGLPKKPLVTSWTEKMSLRFGAAEKL